MHINSDKLTRTKKKNSKENSVKLPLEQWLPRPTLQSSHDPSICLHVPLQLEEQGIEQFFPKYPVVHAKIHIYYFYTGQYNI